MLSLCDIPFTGPCCCSALLFLPPFLSPLYFNQFLMWTSHSLALKFCTAAAPEQVTVLYHNRSSIGLIYFIYNTLGRRPNRVRVHVKSENAYFTLFNLCMYSWFSLDSQINNIGPMGTDDAFLPYTLYVNRLNCKNYTFSESLLFSFRGGRNAL